MSLHRDKARKVLKRLRPESNWEPVLDALEECVAPDPAQTIDRDALVREVIEECARDVEATAGTNDGAVRYELMLAAHSLRTQVAESFLQTGTA